MGHGLPENIDLAKVDEFLSAKGRKVAIYDADPDGITSASLLMRFYPGFEAKPKRGPTVGADFSRLLSRLKPDVLVFLDMAIDHEWAKIRKIPELKNARFVIIDHHIPKRNLNSRNVVHINPMLEKDVYLPTSYLTYRLVESLGKDVKGYMWVAALGVIADYAFKSCRGFLEDARKAYPRLLKGDIKKSRLAKGVDLVSSAITMHGLAGASSVLDRMARISSFGELERLGELGDMRKTVDKEFGRLLGLFIKEKEVDRPLALVMYEIKTPLSLLTQVANAASELHPGKVVIIRKQAGEWWKVSARCQSGRVNVAELLDKCSRGIGSGGGHRKAAGAFVNDWEKFRSRLLRRLRQAKK